MEEVQDAGDGLALSFAREERPCILVFARALGPEHGTLPVPVRDLHDVLHARRWTDMARVERGGGGGRGWPPASSAPSSDSLPQPMRFRSR